LLGEDLWTAAILRALEKNEFGVFILGIQIFNWAITVQSAPFCISSLLPYDGRLAGELGARVADERTFMHIWPFS